jgi:hypothetical protein
MAEKEYMDFKKNSCMVILSFAAISQSFATVYSFNNSSSSSSIDTAANWNSTTLPTISDTVQFRYPHSSPYTLTGDAFTVQCIRFYDNTILDLGAGKSFLVDSDSTNAKVFIYGTDKTVELRSGIFGVGDNGNRFFLGDGDAVKGTLIATGKDSILRTALKASLIIGQGKPDCTLIVKDGATLRGAVTMGLSQEASINNKALVTGEGTRFISDNRYHTSTDWKNYSLGIGGAGSFNEFSLSNKAEMVIGDSRAVLLSIKYGTPSPGSHNLFKVTHGAKASIPFLYAGYQGNSNKVEVLNGGDLSISNTIYVGYQAQNADECLYGNKLLVSGIGSRMFVNSGIYTGYSRCNESRIDIEDDGTLESLGKVRIGCNGSSGHSLHVRNGGKMLIHNGGKLEVGKPSDVDTVCEFIGGVFAATNTSPAQSITLEGKNSRLSFLNGSYAAFTNVAFYANANAINSLIEIRGGSTYKSPFVDTNTRSTFAGVNSKLVVDASTFEGNDFFCTGAGTAAVSNKIEFINGANVKMFRIVVGDQAPYCSLDVDDSKLHITATMGFGYSAKGTKDLHSSFNITGARANVYVENEFMPLNNTSIKITVPEEGFVNQPVINCGWFILSDTTTPSLKIERSKEHFDKDRIVLLKARKANFDVQDFLARYSISLPEGASLDLSDPSQIVLVLPSLRGTMIYLK